MIDPNIFGSDVGENVLVGEKIFSQNNRPKARYPQISGSALLFWNIESKMAPIKKATGICTKKIFSVAAILLDSGMVLYNTYLTHKRIPVVCANEIN